MFLQAITPEEQRKREQVAKLDDSRSALELEVGHRQWQINLTKAELVPALGLTEDIFIDGALAKDILLKAVQMRQDDSAQNPPDDESEGVESARKNTRRLAPKSSALRSR